MSQKNIDRLVGLVKARLNSSGKVRSTDNNGLTIYMDCDVFSRELLEAFLSLSLSDFNQTPSFTDFTFGDDHFVEVFAEVLVEGATIQALASQALLERGREFTFNDGGLNMQPPNVAEMLNTQYSILLSHHFDKLKLIKDSIMNFTQK